MRARAQLQGAKLLSAKLQDANLSYAQLQAANLLNASLRDANLSYAQLQGAILWFAYLRGADLVGAQLQGAELFRAQLQGANLRNARIGVIQIHDPKTNMSTREATDLSGADLTGALLTPATIDPEANLSGSAIDPIIRDEICARDDGEWNEVKNLHGGGRPTFEECEATYRQLKLNLQESGDYQKAGEFYLRERECKRAKYREQGRWWWWIGQGLWYRLCGYGERPWSVLWWMIATVFLFALFQGWRGIGDGTGWAVGPGIEWPSWEGLGRFWTALYFSVVTFTSLGYGDLRPEPGLGRALAGMEAALGLALMSLLLVTIVRKFSR